jgi:predicted N-acetyltransferase YhbS
MAEIGNPAAPKLTGPALLKPGHDISKFECTKPSLDDWLTKHALNSGASDTARTFVVCRGKKVVGYYAIASGGLEQDSAPGSLRRNAPDPIPVTILARLAVDISEQGHGIGSALLTDAMKRAVNASRTVASRALIVHALDADAARFYTDHQFQKLKSSKPDDLGYFISMKAIREGL